MADVIEKYDSEKFPFWVRPLPYDGYTYKEFKTWGEDVRVELIDGIPYLMASPDEWHQWVAMELSGQIRNQLQGKNCSVYAEFDVRLFYKEDESDNTTVRPDIIVVCDESKTLGKKSCHGAPDFVIEILSEFSEGRDFIDKKKKYEKGGVKEYWIVSSDKLHIFTLAGQTFQENTVSIHRDLKQSVSCLEGCFIDFRVMVDRYR